MESTSYGDNPNAILWYRTVFGGKADQLTLEEAFSVADESTLFVVPQSMLETFQGMVFILGKRVGIWVMKPEVPPFEFNNYSSIDAVYPYSLSSIRGRSGIRKDANGTYFRPNKFERRAMITNWRDRGLVL